MIYTSKTHKFQQTREVFFPLPRKTLLMCEDPGVLLVTGISLIRDQNILSTSKIFRTQSQMEEFTNNEKENLRTG